VVVKEDDYIRLWWFSK